MNCWEFMKCGREFGGLKAYEFGVCQAYPNDGKQCAKIAGTVCGGKVQGTFAMKIFDCVTCDFYKSKYYHHHNLKFTSNCNNSNCDN
jgi:hypothetical protein